MNLRRRFSAQRHNVSTTSSSGTGSGTCFATAASSTDSSIDASSLPLFQPPSRSSIAERGSRSPLPKFSISCEGEAGVSRSGDDHDDLDDSRNSTIVSTASSGGADETVRFRRQSSGRTPASQLQLVIPSISSSQSSQSAEPARETCYVVRIRRKVLFSNTEIFSSKTQKTEKFCNIYYPNQNYTFYNFK